MRYVCPANGQPVRCTQCKDGPIVAHHVEELVPPGRKPPVCPTHDIKLVKA
jgi:hypothetical protein